MEVDNLQNPTGIIADEFHGKRIGAYKVEGRLIDCPLKERPALFRELFRERTQRRVAALALGMAKIGHFELETTGANFIDTYAYDGIIGGHYKGPIDPAGPDQFRNSSISYNALASHMNEAGISTKVSDHAGTVGCNATAYSLYALQNEYPIPMLFAHVPHNYEAARQVFVDRGVPEDVPMPPSCYLEYEEASIPAMSNKEIEAGIHVLLHYLARSALNRIY